MNNFIKITVDCNAGPYECYINVNSITNFAKGHSDCNCIIHLCNGEAIRTITTIKEIKELILKKGEGKTYEI